MLVECMARTSGCCTACGIKTTLLYTAGHCVPTPTPRTLYRAHTHLEVMATLLC